MQRTLAGEGFLGTRLDGAVAHTVAEVETMGKVAFVFPGQASQYPGMGKELAEKYPAARAVFDEALQLVSLVDDPAERMRCLLHLAKLKEVQRDVAQSATRQPNHLPEEQGGGWRS